jgi:hypothetical protein
MEKCLKMFDSIFYIFLNFYLTENLQERKKVRKKEIIFCFQNCL